MAMHHMLRDRLKHKARIIESVLLVASVVFCSTTFAGKEFHELIGVDPDWVRLVLGLASVAAFAAALLSMILDWNGGAARHQDAAERWAEVVREFRESRSEGGCWTEDVAVQLSAAYWEASKHTVPIPDKRFNGLKSAYLFKIELSKTIDRYPGTPKTLLWLLVRAKGVSSFVQGEFLAVSRRGGAAK